MGAHTTDPEQNEFVPLMLLVVAIIFGGYAIWEQPGGLDAPYIWGFMLLFSIGGVGYVAWGFNEVRSDSGLHAAVGWLFSESDGSSSTSSGRSSTEKTPPAPEKLKNALRIERADGHCEYCDEESDFLEVHHIKPRSEGGPNTRKNLIALCPTCHRKADRGVYGQSELKHITRQKESAKEA